MKRPSGFEALGLAVSCDSPTARASNSWPVGASRASHPWRVGGGSATNLCRSVALVFEGADVSDRALFRQLLGAQDLVNNHSPDPLTQRLHLANLAWLRWRVGSLGVNSEPPDILDLTSLSQCVPSYRQAARKLH